VLPERVDYVGSLEVECIDPLLFAASHMTRGSIRGSHFTSFVISDASVHLDYLQLGRVFADVYADD